MGSVTALKGHAGHSQLRHIGRVFHLGEKSRGEYGEPPWRLESLVPPHRSNRECELWDTSLSPCASVISIPKLLYLCNLLCDSLRA
jgi:hypothetical protein